jgi:hypothetical protein
MKNAKLYMLTVAIALAMALVLPTIFAGKDCKSKTNEVVLAKNDSDQNVELNGKGDPKPKKVIIIIVLPKPITPKKDSVITAMPQA